MPELIPDWMQAYVDPAEAPAQVFMQPSVDTNPDAFGSAFSDVGFGPGPYVGGYTGVEAGGGLTGIYWGSYDATVAPGSQGTNVFNPVHFAPGAAVINAVRPGSVGSGFEGSGFEGAPSSTGSTFLDPAQGSAASRTVSGVDFDEGKMSEVGGTPGETPGLIETRATPGLIETRAPVTTPGGLDPFSSEGTASSRDWMGTIELDASEGYQSGSKFRNLREPMAVSTSEETGGTPGDFWALSDTSTWERTETSVGVAGEPTIGSETFGSLSSASTAPPVLPSGREYDFHRAVIGDELGEFGAQVNAVEMGPMGKTLTGRTPADSIYDGDSYTGTSSVTESNGTSINSELQSPAAMEMGRVDIGSLPEVPDTGFLLSDLAPEPSYAFELGNFPSGEVPAGFGEYMGDIGNMALTSGGIGTSASALMDFAEARLTDFGVGMAMMPFFNWMNKQTGNAWTSRMVQLSLATMGLALAGDPFGLIVAPIGWMIQDFIEARQRVLANDDPEKIKGKKWGYVREGNRWYPAVTESESKDEGYGTNRSVLMIKYGDNLKWEKDKEGAWYPTFDHVKFKEFHVSTDEIYGAKAGNEYRERKDPLRDFYFLGDEETSAMLQNFAGGSLMQKYSQDDDHKFTPEEQAEYQSAQATAFSSFEQHDDRGWRESWRPQNEGGNARFVDGSWQTEVDAYGKNYAPLADSMQDSRAAIDMIHDWKHSAKGGVSRGDEDFWEGSILLRRVVNEQGSIGTAPWAAAPRLMPLQNSNRVSYADMPEVLQYYGGPKRDSYIRSKGLSRNTDDWGGAGNPQSWFGGQAENNFYIEQFYSHMKMLYASQKAAATTMGFKDRYHFDALSSDEVAAKYPDQAGYLNMINANGWYHMYLDNSWDMPEIKTAQQLHDELLDIEEAGDAEHIGSTHYRNSQQQEYLAQKAIVRYWAQKIDGLGGGPQLLSALQGSEEYVNGPPRSGRRATTRTTRRGTAWAGTTAPTTTWKRPSKAWRRSGNRRRTRTRRSARKRLPATRPGGSRRVRTTRTSSRGAGATTTRPTGTAPGGLHRTSSTTRRRRWCSKCGTRRRCSGCCRATSRRHPDPRCRRSRRSACVPKASGPRRARCRRKSPISRTGKAGTTTKRTTS